MRPCFGDGRIRQLQPSVKTQHVSYIISNAFAIRKLALAIVVVAALLVPQAATASDTTERLQTAVARMNAWLDVGKKAQTWRKVLDLNVLDSQAARGDQADPETLQSLLSGFERGDESLKNPVFQEVASAIRAQIEQINRTRSQSLVDLQFAARQAVSGFTPAFDRFAGERSGCGEVRIAVVEEVLSTRFG